MQNALLNTVSTGIEWLEHIGMPFGKHRGEKTGHPYRDLDPRQLWGRSFLAARYIRGEGLEIGALHLPLKVFRRAKVRYVDFMSVEDAQKHYPELAGFDLVTPDYIENGEELPSIPTASQDFIIANHFIEHCEDPIKTIQNFLERLKPGGILFMAVPMRDFTFDKDRPLTPLEHIVTDYREGAQKSRNQHYEEWARLVMKTAEGDVQKTVEDLLSRHYSIHFHVWNFESFKGLLEHLRDKIGLPFDIVSAATWKFNPFESVYVLRKV